MSASRSGRNTCWCFVAEEMRRCARGDWAVPRVHLTSLRRHHAAPTAHSSCQHTTNTPLSCQPVPVAHRACWGARQRSEPLLSVPWICSRRACHVGRQRAHHCGERCEGLKPGASGTLGMPKSAERRTYVRTAQGAASGCTILLLLWRPSAVRGLLFWRTRCCLLRRLRLDAHDEDRGVGRAPCQHGRDWQRWPRHWRPARVCALTEICARAACLS